MTRYEMFIGLSSLIICAITTGFTSNPEEWQRMSAGINENEINVIACDPVNKNLIYAGTASGLYYSKNGGNDFIPQIQIQGKNNKVNDIYITPDLPSKIFVATDSGLFYGNGIDGIWNKIYEVARSRVGFCLSTIICSNRLYLGTGQGLYSKDLKADNWEKMPGRLGYEAIYKMAKDGQYLYLVTASDLFRLDSNNRLEKVYGLLSEDEETSEDYEEGELPPRKIKDIFVLQQERPIIYLCKEDEILFSNDQGRTWQRFQINGQTPSHINKMLIIRNESHGVEAPGWDEMSSPARGFSVYVAADEGVFKYFQDRWEQIYKGLEINKINSIISDRENNLYAATDSGLFFMPTAKAVSPAVFKNVDYDTVLNKFKNEPAIQDVQKIAVAYAEVHKGKIDDWRRRAHNKAWLPDLRMGLSTDKNKTLSDSIWGSYTSGGQLFIGPDEKTFYNNLGWDVSLAWDLGDLIWNSDQTSIDSRSKMMVELRDDILDQITRLYYERRRLQFELEATEAADPYFIFDKKMRIEELTALIDALTGGEFSKKIEMNAINNN